MIAFVAGLVLGSAFGVCLMGALWAMEREQRYAGGMGDPAVSGMALASTFRRRPPRDGSSESTGKGGAEPGAEFLSHR